PRTGDRARGERQHLAVQRWGGLGKPGEQGVGLRPGGPCAGGERAAAEQRCDEQAADREKAHGGRIAAGSVRRPERRAGEGCGGRDVPGAAASPASPASPASSTGCRAGAAGSGRTAGRSVSSTVVPGTSRLRRWAAKASS